VQRFRGGLVFKALRLLYHSTLGLRVIKKKKREVQGARIRVWGSGFRVRSRVQDSLFRIQGSRGKCVGFGV